MSMMVEIADKAGACFGVERALRMTLGVAREATGPVHTLGPLIHNPTVVVDLAARGVTVVEDPAVGPGATVLLRTHGVAPDVEDAAIVSGATVIDATCPFVKKVHKVVERLARDDYQILIVGEQGHPEVEGTLGHAHDAVVVGNAEEVRALDLHRRVGVVVQTTMADRVLREVVDELVSRVEELRVFNTICSATAERQAAAAELAARSDVMIVIGGRNSANTTHLAEICSAVCARTHHIETASELESAWFDGVSAIGITAGASTPLAQVDEVRAAIEQLVNP